LRSEEWFSPKDLKTGFIHRSWMRNQGYPDDYFRGRPVIGICNTWSEFNPCRGLQEKSTGTIVRNEDYGYVGLYIRTVQQSHLGADLDFLRGGSGSVVKRDVH
jgi:dihydroxyacid dehydratase/phosphogluconate dehydratase